MNKIYLCIDLKTFYASVECVERGLDPFKTRLVVADKERGSGTICLAVSPKMKELGVKNRCRLFEIPKSITYIAAKPRMKLYIKYSADIYGIYLKYVDKDDIHVYSIDECFIDATKYLKLYQKSAETFAKLIIDDIYNIFKITATAGIGTNLYLAKIALDISAKHNKSNIAYLDEELYKKTLWSHTPPTDFWQIGKGIEKRLNKHHLYTMEDVSKCDSLVLYKEFGVNAEYLIDHANGIEPVTIKDIKKYKSQSQSLSYGQVLFEDYDYEHALLVVKEMVELACLDLVDKQLVTNNLFLSIGYSKDVIKSTGSSIKILEQTNSYKTINSYFMELFDKNTNHNYPIRRISLGFNNVIREEDKEANLFTDVEEEAKEKRVQKAILDIKKKFGKNAILKGMNLEDKATTISRNKLVGGHNGE